MRCEAFVNNKDGRCTQGISQGAEVSIEGTDTLTLFRQCRNHKNTWDRRGMENKSCTEKLAFFAKGTGEVRAKNLTAVVKEGDTITHIDINTGVETTQEALNMSTNNSETITLFVQRVTEYFLGDRKSTFTCFESKKVEFTNRAEFKAQAYMVLEMTEP